MRVATKIVTPMTNIKLPIEKSNSLAMGASDGTKYSRRRVNGESISVLAKSWATVQSKR